MRLSEFVSKYGDYEISEDKNIPISGEMIYVIRWLCKTFGIEAVLRYIFEIKY